MRKRLEIECHNCGQKLTLVMGERFKHACIGGCDTPGSLDVTLTTPREKAEGKP